MQSKLINYLESQRREAQWGLLLQTFAQEVSSALGPDEARRALVKAGMAAARDMVLPACDSIQQMETAANQHWSRLGWGVVSFFEHADSLEISHEGAPGGVLTQEILAVFLEGVYQQWFVAVGAGAQLQVRQYKDTQNGIFLYRLAA